MAWTVNSKLHLTYGLDGRHETPQLALSILTYEMGIIFGFVPNNMLGMLTNT
jgi:hypothetical protein